MESNFTRLTDICAVCSILLSFLVIASLGVTVRLYLDHDKRQHEELAQCIVMGIAVPAFIASSAYLNDLKITASEWHVRLVLMTSPLLAIAAGIFAILGGVNQIQGLGPERTTLDTVSTFLNCGEIVLAAVMIGPTVKLLKALQEHKKGTANYDGEQNFGIPRTDEVSQALSKMGPETLLQEKEAAERANNVSSASAGRPDCSSDLKTNV